MWQDVDEIDTQITWEKGSKMSKVLDIKTKFIWPFLVYGNVQKIFTWEQKPKSNTDKLYISCNSSISISTQQILPFQANKTKQNSEGDSSNHQTHHKQNPSNCIWNGQRWVFHKLFAIDLQECQYCQLHFRWEISSNDR